MYDYVIAGAGLFGSTFARLMAEKGKKTLILEKRNHIGGNCYTEKKEDINVHVYGPHCFHCKNKNIWDFVNRFTKFNNFTLRSKVNFQGKIYSFPINLMTLHQLWGIKTPKEAENKLNLVRVPIANPNNLEEWILSQVGEELYYTFIKGYTIKQWNRSPKELPASIVKRLPIRLSFDDRYFDDPYQGIPEHGYTAMFENMLDHPNIEVKLGIDFLTERPAGKQIIYTGKIDEYFNYKYGELEYRSLKFETDVFEGDFQGNAIINYTDQCVPYTRIVEHKHFEYKNSNKTVVTWEYPQTWDRTKEAFYPINNDKNNALYKKYKALGTDVVFAGRLGGYFYQDMHQTIGAAMSLVKRISPLP